MCCLYAICKVCEKEIKFKSIVNMYKELPYAEQHVSVETYNRVFCRGHVRLISWFSGPPSSLLRVPHMWTLVCPRESLLRVPRMWTLVCPRESLLRVPHMWILVCPSHFGQVLGLGSYLTKYTWYNNDTSHVEASLV